jgi:WD40 repeat protein
MIFDFGAYVTAALFGGDGKAAFALGDGTVRLEGGESLEAHDGAALAAVVHPSGEGVVSGGDDGRLVWSRAGGTTVLAERKGRWIDAVAASAESGLIAFSAGREVGVRDARDAKFARTFVHERSVAGLAFDAKGRRIAAATYGGLKLWFARIESQQPKALNWAGSHIQAVWSPDGRFIISSMQENALHGWRVDDAKDMRMGGYPAKVKSLVFLDGGKFLATAGANGAVLWPFGGANGPMGKEASEIGFDEAALVAQVAAQPDKPILAAGLDDGRLWIANLATGRLEPLKAEKGAPITALALSRDARRLAWGDEEGQAGVVEAPELMSRT